MEISQLNVVCVYLEKLLSEPGNSDKKQISVYLQSLGFGLYDFPPHSLFAHFPTITSSLVPRWASHRDYL